MNKYELFFILVLYIPVVVYNIYWAFRYKEIYWNVLLLRNSDYVFFSVCWVFNVFPILVYLLLKVIL